MKKIFIAVAVILILAVAMFASADTKTELALKVQFLQEKGMRLLFERVLVLQHLEKARGELKAIVDKEKEEAQKEKVGKDNANKR